MGWTYIKANKTISGLQKNSALQRLLPSLFIIREQKQRGWEILKVRQTFSQLSTRNKKIVGYLDQVNKKVAAFSVQKLKLSKSAVFQVLKTMKIGDILKNFGKCPKMAYFGQNLAKIWASIARISKTMGAISTIPQVVINYVFLHAKFKFYQNRCSITAAMIFWKFTFFFKIFPNFTFSLKAKYL